MSFPGNSPWTKIECAKDTYVSEASCLNRDTRCPKCDTEIPNDQWRTETDSEGEPILWQHMCLCGTLMKVFND